MTSAPAKKKTHTDDWVRKQKEKNAMARQQLMRRNQADAEPVIEDLARVGLRVQWISDLYSKRLRYKDAIPILLYWLPRIANRNVKEAIVRALSVPWAKSIAAPALIQEYRKVEATEALGLTWAIGNALSVVADDTVFDEIAELVSDSRNGRSREMLVLALGNMKDARAPQLLIRLLEDEELAGHAIMALGGLRSRAAVSAIKRFEAHPKAWVRREAKNALSRIAK